MAAYWLTISKGRAECACGEVICNGPIVFQASSDPRYRDVICPECAESRGIETHPSKAYREWHEQNRQLTLV
jgi:hypothetical protein